MRWMREIADAHVHGSWSLRLGVSGHAAYH